MAIADIWLIGDSHAEHWEPGLDKFSKAHNLSGVLYARNSRLPIWDIKQHRDAVMMNDDAGWREGFRTLLKDHPPATLILTARWALYYNTGQFMAPSKTPYYTTLLEDDARNISETQTVLEAELIDTIKEMRAMGHHVVLLGQIPEYGTAQTDCVERAISQKTEIKCGPPQADVLGNLTPAHAMLERAARAGGAKVILPSDFLCNETRCKVMIAGSYIYRDDDHMNADGARRLIEALSPDFLAAIHPN